MAISHQSRYLGYNDVNVFEKENICKDRDFSGK